MTYFVFRDLLEDYESGDEDAEAEIPSEPATASEGIDVANGGMGATIELVGASHAPNGNETISVIVNSSGT